ncbi:uncharacterized protein [Temnothorax longispinosus]|uniref:uncharacterized protein n=1 Tax=Temnothorax longispinosus TaxID=300112 RepID=UPI003A9A0951
MVLSLFKDIVLEVIVIVVTFLLWRKGNGSTSLLFEFIAEKTVNLVVSTCKWCTTFKWYTQLRRMAKIRRFAIIARRSIANIVNIPGRVNRSLDDECLGIAIIRRGKYASLLNLDRLSEELSSRANAKSLTTLITEDTSDTNDYNSDVNDLSVAEKSMRMLKVTAEDVMDARARIQERSYWEEQDVTAKTPEVIEGIVAQFPLEKIEEEEMIDASRNKQTAKDGLEKAVDRAWGKEDIMGYFSVNKKEEIDKEIIPVDGKEQNSIRNQEDILLVKGNDVTDKVDNHAKSMESCDTYVTAKKKRKEEEEGEVAKIVQYSSFQGKTARSMEAKPCASLVRKLEAKFCLVNQKEKWIERVDRRKHPQVNAQLTPTGSGASKKESYKNSKICACHRALRNSSKTGRHVRSIGIDGKNVEYDIDGKDFRFFTPIVNMQRSKLDRSALKYSEAYRLKKQIQKWEESRGKQSRGSESSAQTARPSGCAKNVVDAADKLSTIVNCRKSAQIETHDESMMMSDSFSERHRLKHKQMRSERSVDLRSVYNVASFREKNYAEAHETKTKGLENCNNFTSKYKGETKARKRHDLPPANVKLSIEEREAIELRALRAYNELTLSEDKRELEVRKEHDSSLNYGRLAKESEVPGTKVLQTYNDPTLTEDKREAERTRGHNLSPSSQQSVDERSASRVRDELIRPGNEREPRTERKRDLSRDETPSECEDVEAPTSVYNRLSMGSCHGSITIPVHRNANRGSDLNDRCARRAHMSLNLREITRNIECTVHPRGIILTNKNLHGQFSEDGRFRESHQRDIVDDNTASTLHSAFFFKPEIIARVFRRAQTRFGESFPNFPTFRREDLDTEFVCRVNNEMVVRNRDSLFDLERMVGNDRNALADPAFSRNANDDRRTGGERGHDLCIIFIGREQIPSETETVIVEDSTTGARENARSSVESTRTTNIVIFDEDCNRAGSAINDNLPVRLITGVLRNFDIEMPEGSIHDVASPNDEYESNVNVYSNPQARESNADDINLDEENNNKCDRISSRNNADVDDAIHEIEQTLNSSDDNCPDDVNVTSYSSLEKLNNSRDEKYLSTIDIHSENENNLFLESTCNNTTLQLSDNNNNNDTLDNKSEKSTFNRIFKNSSKSSFPGPSSFIESDNSHALRSCDEELQKLTHLSESAATLNNQRKESILNLKTTNCDTISQFRSIETFKLETTMHDGAKSKNESREVYEEANEFLTEKIFKMHSDDNLHQDDSFYFTYERNDDPGTPVSLEDGSLMEDFLTDPIP